MCVYIYIFIYLFIYRIFGRIGEVAVAINVGMAIFDMVPMRDRRAGGS